jgi:hypothetical protein
MAKCTNKNIFGFLADAEFAGKTIDESGFSALSLKEKIGYSGRSSTLHAKGIKENPSQAIKEQMKKFKDIGLKQNGLGGNFRDPLVLFGDAVKPVVDAGKAWKETVLNQGLSREKARMLWEKEVKPVVEKQRVEAYKANPEGYYKHMADKYFDDMAEGVEVFGGDESWISGAARKGAQYYTGYAPHIAIYDIGELVTKGMTRFGPWHFTKGLATALVKSKGKILGRLEENKSLYFGIDYATDKSKFKQGADWLLEHINPQYYSNNLLVNGSAEMARSAGMDVAEGVRKVGFIKEIGNTPAYLRSGGGEITWARYSTEAAKFWLDIHADLGRAVLNKNPKAFIGALGSVLAYHGTMTALAGVGSSLPAMPDKLLKMINDSSDEETFFDRVDRDIPFTNLVTKATGIDAKQGLQLGVPAFGLAYGASSGLIGKPVTNLPKIKEALQQGDTATAFALSYESVAGPIAFTRFGGPWATKTGVNSVKLGADYWADQLTPKEKVELLTGKGSAVGF